MSVKLREITKIMEKFAPLGLALPWDNCGLALGRAESDVSKILLALDATPAVIKEAVALGAGLIIAHHPLIFNPIKQITDATPVGSALLGLAENGVALYCAHTNLDACDDGVNDAFGDALGIKERRRAFFETNLEGGPSGFGHIGRLESETPLGEFARRVKARLADETVIFSGAENVSVKTVGYCCGSGGKYIPEAAASDCDVFVTGDVKHSDALLASAFGLNLVVCGHFHSETLVLARLLDYLRGEIPEAEILLSATERAPLCKI